jgi:hypothetical protein
MENNIQYSYAQHNESKKPIHISQVGLSNKDNLTCPDCKEILIAVINHPTPHFRHKPNSDCATNTESQIHWLSKEVFKDLKIMRFPQINMDDIHIQYAKLYSKIDKLITKEVPDDLIENFFDSLKYNLTESQTLKIQKVELEKTFKTSLGDVRIDIVLTINNQLVFIEPWYTNPISTEKKLKLQELKIPTISIPLKQFIEKHPKGYTTNKLKKYILSEHTKTWSYLKPTSIDKHIDKYIDYVISKISKQKENYNLLDKLDLITKENESKINQLHKYQNAILYQQRTIKKYPTRNHNKLSLIQEFIKK